MNCTNCGAAIQNGQYYCGNCGKQVGTVPSTQYGTFLTPPLITRNSYPGTSQARQSGKAIWIALVILLIVIVAFGSLGIGIVMGSRGGNTTGPSNKGPVTGLTTIPTQTASMSTPTPTPIQNPSPTPSPTGTSIVRKDLGLQQYWHEDGPYPQPPDKNGAIVAHGDIRDDGSCHIKIFYSGDTVENLGHGTFRLVQLTVIGAATGGYKKAIYQYVVDNIQSQLGDCPII